jgi:hypothetical protein
VHGWYDLPGLNGAPCLLKKKERERRATYKWTARQSANDQNAPPGHKKLSHLYQKAKRLCFSDSPGCPGNKRVSTDQACQEQQSVDHLCCHLTGCILPTEPCMPSHCLSVSKETITHFSLRRRYIAGTLHARTYIASKSLPCGCTCLPGTRECKCCPYDMWAN